MASLDEFDAELLEAEEAIRHLEEQLQGLRPPAPTPPPSGKKGDAERVGVPGRWCRAGYVPTWRPALGRGSHPTSEPKRQWPSTFGSARRFGTRQEIEGDFLLYPVDGCLSTTIVAKGAKMYSDSVKPRQISEAKRWLESIAEQSKCKEAFEILQSAGSLSAVTAAWQALLAEERRKELNFDDASTDAGSELSELLSVSSVASTSSSLVPGPGSYSPNYEVLRPNLAKGAPSFSRYSARERHEEDEPERADDSASVSLLSNDGCQGSTAFACPGGKILPPHSTRPRRPTASQLDAACSAQRPLPCFEGTKSLEVLQVTQAQDDAWARDPSTGRLKALEKEDVPGPGDYDLPALPGAPAALIAPPSERVKEEVAAPGPAQYDLRASEALLYPRAPGGQFGLPRPDVMEYQQCPDYIAGYDALEMNFEKVEPRVPNALILPEESEEALRALQIMKHRAPATGTGARVGPGTYQEDDCILQRSRPDRKVLPWRPRTEGVAEHLVGLHKHYTRFGRWRLDDRTMLGVADDLSSRRSRPRAFIQPPHQPPLKRNWSAEDIWRLYLPKLDEPLGQNFARNLDFDEWQEKEQHWRWLSVRHFCRTRPSLRLSYSLPDMELVKDRAPEADFSKAPGRSPMAMAEEVEGDLLLLDPACHELRYPRVPQPVDMAKQLGRNGGGSDDLVDDFEELVLSPKRLEKRSRCFVDMAKEPGRPPEPEWDPHIWAEEPDRVFCYQPTNSFETEDVLDLSPASAQRRLQRRVPTYDLARCMGRAGHDLRLASPGKEEEAPALLTNWEAPFVAPPRPMLGPVTSTVDGFHGDLGGCVLVETSASPEPPPPLCESTVSEGLDA